MIFQYSQRGRVVKALVLKTDTFTFAGSSPVADVFKKYLPKVFYFLKFIQENNSDIVK